MDRIEDVMTAASRLREALNAKAIVATVDRDGAVLVQDGQDLVDYLKRFDLTLSVMQTAESLERTARELCEDAAAENVRYLEIRYSPILHQQGDLTLEEAVEAPLRGVRQAEQELGIRAQLIVCGIRNLPPETSVRLAELAVAFKDRGVTAFDLAGGEAGHPAVEMKLYNFTAIMIKNFYLIVT